LIVYLGIGSNIDPHTHIDNAKQALTKQFSTARFSRTYQSQAVGFSGNDFLNLVAEIHTQASLIDLIEQIKQLEDKLGRRRGGEKFSSRHIDIDILLYGNEVTDTPIILPREEIRDNAYVLRPLAELAPELPEPGGDQTYGQIWREFDQTAQQLTPID